MPIIERINVPKTHRGKKFLLSREPKLIENKKQTLFLKGRKSCQVLQTAMKDLFLLKKPECRLLSKKNDIVPFENATPLEILAKKNDSSLFFFGSHTKKRPNNIVIGQTFDKTVLDMFELELSQYKALNDFKNEKVSFGIKPCLVFSGPEWEQTIELQRLRTLFIDFFQREQVVNLRLQGVEHVLSFTVTPESTILLRSYRILLKKSGTKTPRVELEEIGPSFDLKIRRTKLASNDLYKLACKKPKALKAKPKKNISQNKLGVKMGRIHMGKQNIKSLQTRKIKGLRNSKKEKK